MIQVFFLTKKSQEYHSCALEARIKILIFHMTSTSNVENIGTTHMEIDINKSIVVNIHDCIRDC